MFDSSAKYQKGWTEQLEEYVYDEDEYSNQFSVKIIRNYIDKFKKPLKILDVGCADGKLISQFSNKHEVFGVDISPKFVRSAKKNGLKAKVASLEEKIPFPDNFFDIIVCHHVIEHIINTDQFLNECNRVLKKSGIFLLTFPNVNSPVSLILYLLDYPAYTSARYRSTHVRDFTLKTVKKALLYNGFKVEGVMGGHF